MSITYVGAELRRLVVSRAQGLCEYCLIGAIDTVAGCSVDHVISEKHGGPTNADNLAYACIFCNQAKGTDIGSIYWDSGEFLRFFNPRKDAWIDHFALGGLEIVAKTKIGSVTARILRFNDVDRLREREDLKAIGKYPSPEARHLLDRLGGSREGTA